MTPYDKLAEARALLAAQLATAGADPTLVATVLQGQHELTPRERAELDAWLAGRLPDTVRVVTPMRADASSAVRAGMLTRGQWRGIPVIRPGIPVDCPEVDSRAWCVEAALAAGDPARKRAHKRAKRQAQRRNRK